MKTTTPMSIRLCALLLCAFLLSACSVQVIGYDDPTDTIPPKEQEVISPLQTTTPPTSTQPPVTTPALTTPVTTLPPAPPAIPTEPFEELARNGRYIAVYDLKNDCLLYTTDLEQAIYPASTTKLLTLQYALTLTQEDTIFTVGSEINIAPYDSSKAKIRQGERYTRRDIFAALLLPSGNDAAYTLAATCGRLLAPDETLTNQQAVDRFMEGLNQYAVSLGLNDTHFVTPDGYHHKDHVTSMADMLTIAKLAMEQPLIAELTATATYTVTDLDGKRTQVWQNSNFLLHESNKFYYPYATGCKTGFHDSAGACLIATAKKGDEELMVMVFKCSNKDARFTDAVRFLELGFELLES